MCNTLLHLTAQNQKESSLHILTTSTNCNCSNSIEQQKRGFLNGAGNGGGEVEIRICFFVYASICLIAPGVSASFK